MEPTTRILDIWGPVQKFLCYVTTYVKRIENIFILSFKTCSFHRVHQFHNRGTFLLHESLTRDFTVIIVSPPLLVCMTCLCN